MKRAKIMLTAIAILGLVGGALAFKAKSTYGSILYTATTSTIQATTTRTATTTDEGTQKVYVTFVYNQLPTLYTYTIAKP